ncbi:MAG: hypothetical protein RI928_1570 [Pseudomonadota bacterium]
MGTPAWHWSRCNWPGCSRRSLTVVPVLARALVVPVRVREAPDAVPVLVQGQALAVPVPESAQESARALAQGQAQVPVPGASAQAVPDAAELARDAGALVSVVPVWEARALEARASEVPAWVVAAWVVPVSAVRAWVAARSVWAAI